MEDFYATYKGMMFRLAYQLTGSAADAEDIVQDVFVKAHDIRLEQLAQPKAYLCKMTTNRSLDLLRSARKKRELYVGPWLPEPVPTAAMMDTAEAVIHKDMLSYAVLVLLERLSPTERAAFVLREALALPYADIAELIGKSEANCRKLISRAKSKMGITPDELIASQAADSDWLHKFLSALEQGNTDTLLSLLSEDAVLVSDGGGKVSAAIHPIVTRERIAAFLLGLLRKTPQYEDLRVELMSLNGQTAVVVRAGTHIEMVVFLQLRQNAIGQLYFIRNPEKLTSLIP